MSRNAFVALSVLAMCFFSVQGWGQEAVEEPGHAATADLTFSEVVDLINNDLLEARKLGLAVFSSPFNSLDGFGDGPFIATEVNNQFGFGARPTAQGNGADYGVGPQGQFLRVGGLDAQSCNECHVFVSHRTLPPTLGLAGVGGVATSAFPGPTLFDVADSLDDRVIYMPYHVPDLRLEHDGVADYNGRLINPPFLYGGGGIELLAKEMTFFLQEILAAAKAAPAGTTLPLVVPYGVPPISFGSVTSLGGGEVELDLEGIGLNEDITEEEQLVVRPFGRKGENFTMRDFDRGAMMFHFGIQPDEVFDFDQDLDGMDGEVSVAEMTALHSFDVTNPKPVEDPRDFDAQIGFAKFNLLGCSYCHRPELWTYTRDLPLAHPEVPEDPLANVYAQIDMVDVGFAPTPSWYPGDGIKVPMYSDLKRHDMGDNLAETAEAEFSGDPYGLRPISNREFITARLWGIADTNPYLHDGRATTLHQAILMHGGEAQFARDNYAALSEGNQLRVIKFLRTLRTPENPNEELLQ